MTDIVESLYDIRDTAWERAQILKRRIAKDTAELAEQEKLWKQAEQSAELLCASDLFPSCNSNVPKESGLIRLTPKPAPSRL
jgi:hypothetical protein